MNKWLKYSSANYSSKLHILLSSLALLFGGLIYLLLRPADHIFFHWISTFGFDNWLNVARHHSLTQTLQLSEWIVFSLPNGLWAFAYALLITGIWSGSTSWLKYFWMASIPVLVLGFEVLQLAGIIRGTFSMQDLAFGVTGLLIGIIVGNKINKSNNHEKVFE